MEERDLFNVSVQAVIYNNKKEILLLKRSSHLPYGNMYSLPGGHLEKNESVIDGIIRELKEEIGVIFKEDELKLIKVINRKVNKNNYIDFIYEGYLKNQKAINLEKDKCIRMIYRDINKIPFDSIPVLKRVVEDNKKYIMMEE